MNRNLEKLIEVNQLDLEVAGFNPLIEAKKAPIYAKINEKNRYTKQKQELEEKIIEKQDLLEKNNSELAVVAADIEKIREKLKDSKSEKEMKNLGMEEDILREKTTAFNDEIALLEKEIVSAKEKIGTLDSDITRLDGEILEIESACKDDINAIKKQQDEISAKRQAVALEMEQAILRLYEKIRKWAGNSSVTAIYKDACGGCFIKLNDKNIIDIRKGIEIVHCPHCGRILYDSVVIEGAEGTEGIQKETKK